MFCNGPLTKKLWVLKSVAKVTISINISYVFTSLPQLRVYIFMYNYYGKIHNLVFGALLFKPLCINQSNMKRISVTGL